MDPPQNLNGADTLCNRRGAMARGSPRPLGRARMFALLALIVAPVAALYTFVTVSHLFLADDAYYYFKIAKNVAAGYGSTFDRINPTNGYHPLWCLLLSVLALGHWSPHGFVSLALVTQCVLVAAAFWLVWLTLRDRAAALLDLAALIVFATIAWNHYLSKILINGLESALLVFVLGGLLYLCARYGEDARGLTVRRAALLGFVLLAAILARLDAVFFVPAVGLVWLIRERRAFRRVLPRLLLLGAVPALGVLAYLLVNERLFGIGLPVSGYMKRVIWSEGPNAAAVVCFGLVLLVLLAGLLLAQGRLRCDLRTRSGMTLGVLSIYCVIFHADQHLVRGGRVPELWYLGPQLLWVFCVVCLWGARRVRASNRVRLLRMATLGALGFLLAVASWAIRLERASYDGTLALYEAAQWVNTNLPPDTIVGCWDAGVFGYYAEPRVVNLDGLVNSLEFAQALQSGTGVQFLDRKGVSYLAQYFPRGFENYCPTGFDAAQLHARAQQTLFVRPVTARSFADLIRTGRRPLRHWTVEVRAWAPPAAAPTSLTKSPAAAPTAESRSALAEQPR